MSSPSFPPTPAARSNLLVLQILYLVFALGLFVFRLVSVGFSSWATQHAVLAGMIVQTIFEAPLDGLAVYWAYRLFKRSLKTKWFTRYYAAASVYWMIFFVAGWWLSGLLAIIEAALM